MFELTLSEEERASLLFLLEECISDIRMEITDTDRTDYKNMLKHRKQLLQDVHQRLQQDQSIPLA